MVFKWNIHNLVEVVKAKARQFEKAFKHRGGNDYFGNIPLRPHPHPLQLGLWEL